MDLHRLQRHRPSCQIRQSFAIFGLASSDSVGRMTDNVITMMKTMGISLRQIWIAKKRNEIGMRNECVSELVRNQMSNFGFNILLRSSNKVEFEGDSARERKQIILPERIYMMNGVIVRSPHYRQSHTNKSAYCSTARNERTRKKFILTYHVVVRHRTVSWI